jgi:uncharacterized protein YcnI
MTEVIRGEFGYPFELDIDLPRPTSVSGVAIVAYEAERYSKSEGWFIENISVSEMTIEKAYDDEGDETSVGSDEVSIIADYINSKESDDLIYRAIEDASERSFYG